MSGSEKRKQPPPSVAQPTPRRGALALDPIDANAAASSCTQQPSPEKASKESWPHPFGEGTYCGSWACGRPEGRGTYVSYLGSSFVGLWRRGWADGAGVYHWSDGRADVGRFQGEADRLPLLAAIGEGVRWSRDRSRAALLKNGIETGEDLSVAAAEEIGQRLGIVPPVPLARSPPAHAPARVSKRELEMLHPLFSKQQRTAIDSRLSTSRDAKDGGAGGEDGDDEAEEEEGSDSAVLPFEQLWDLICPK